MRTSLARFALLAAAILVTPVAFAQLKVQYMKPGTGTVCYLDRKSVHTIVPAPEAYLRMKAGHGRTQASNIQVTYEGFTSEAQASFEAAVEIWESLIQTDVTINILARWAPLGEDILGSAGPGSYTMNFDGAQRNNIWYPIALAEKMAGKELNDPTDPDIVATFNSGNPSWHFGLDGSAPPQETYDLLSVVLHEIGHGLGITHAYTVSGGTGFITGFFNGRPVVYETNLESADNQRLVEFFSEPSGALGAQLAGSNLFYGSPLVTAVNANQRAKVYAPDDYSPGSSIAHLDEDTYSAGSANALMTPFISAAERALSPGPIVMNIMKEMGWLTTFINHTPLTATENTTVPYDVVCQVTSDTGFDASTLTLNYSTDGSAFTSIGMLPTGTANEFKASIPTGNSRYNYFISVEDSDDRLLTKPGTVYAQGQPTTQGVFTFDVGPDNNAPNINHESVQFMATHDTLRIQAVVSDKLGVLEVKMEWELKGVAQPDQTLTLKPGTDSTYVIGIIFPPGTLQTGDQINYRLRAKDNAVAGNVSHVPSATGFFEINVTGLASVEEYYFNDFNSLSDADFFGNGFSITTPSGFEDGAIHSQHPYPAGGAGGTDLDFIYQLKVPIKIKETDPFISFDEIVLVEPGEPGSVFGTSEFFDYVIVEGSKDGGITWVALADGYDSRSRIEWLSHYNSAITGQNSTAAGNPGLYRSRIINILENFDVNDVVAFRFRIFSDPFAAGWGWAIDNLSIQLDTQSPTILHQHTDYLMAGATEFEVNSKITDTAGLDRVMVEYKINNGAVETSEAIVDPTKDLYTISLTFPALAAGDVLSYRISAVDKVTNAAVYPPTDFFKIVGLSLASPVNEYNTQFNASSADFAGNFFAVGVTDGFTNSAIHSPHPYNAALGIEPLESNYAWYLTRPIRVNATDPFIVFDEVVLTEYSGTTPVDFVVMEASKDGVLWEKLIPEHAANLNTIWKQNYDVGGAGNSTMFVQRVLRITDTGKFAAGDVILLRFRLFSNSSITGWGFAIDNLSIQGPVTGLKHRGEELSIYPNPVSGDELYIRYHTSSDHAATSVISTQGQVLSTEVHSARNGALDASIYIGDLPAGLYMLRVETEEGIAIRKFVRTH